MVNRVKLTCYFIPRVAQAICITETLRRNIMEKYHFTLVDSGKRLTDKEIQEIRDIMSTIIARYIVKKKKR